MTEWYEDAAFWKDTRAFIFPDSRMAAASEELDGIHALLVREVGFGLTAGTRVLDVPCGPGRHSVAAAERGCVVTGVDLTRAHVEAARERADAAGVEVTTVEADMYRHRFTGTFDVALNLFSSIGYTCDERDDARLLDTVHGVLRPGGALVVDTMSKEILARIFEPVRYLEFGGWIAKVTVRVEDAWRVVRTRMELTRESEDRVVEFRHAIYGASDLVRLMEAAGFDVSVFGGYGGQAYDHEAERLVLIGQRAPS